jgi:hypothetical protein
MPLADVRKSISSHLGWGRKGLEKVAELVNPVIRQAIQEATAAAAAAAAEPTATTAESMAKIIEGMGEEPTAAKNFVYFLTVSRVLPTTLDATDLRDIRDVSREQMAEWVRDAFEGEAPASSTAASKRPRTEGLVTKLAVFREEHADGDPHFHIAVKLSKRSRRRAAPQSTQQPLGHLLLGLPACVASMCFVRKRLAPPRVRNRLEAVGHAIS